MVAESVQEWKEWREANADEEGEGEEEGAGVVVAADLICPREEEEAGHWDPCGGLAGTSAQEEEEEEPVSPTSPTTFDRQRCWVCYDGNDGEKGRLVECCSCESRMCHKKCLHEWKEMMDGTREASTCEVCGNALKTIVLTAKHMGNIVNHFQQFDTDRTGRLTLLQLVDGLGPGTGVDMGVSDVEELFGLCDKNGDEEITMMEYMSGCKKFRKLLHERGELG